MYVKTRESAYTHTKRTHARTHMYVTFEFSDRFQYLPLAFVVDDAHFHYGFLHRTSQESEIGFKDRFLTGEEVPCRAPWKHGREGSVWCLTFMVDAQFAVSRYL